MDSSDYIDGGAGNDTLTAAITANGQTIAPMLKNVEDITLTITAADTKTTTIDATDFTGANTVTIKNAGAVSMATSDELITVSNLAKTTTLGIVGGTASAGATASEITATFASAAAADTQNVAISTLGKVGVLTLSTAETVNITATGTGTTGANVIGSLAAIAVKTLNLKGAGDLTISASDLEATTTVNASTATGKITFAAEAGTTSFTFTGGSADTSVSGTSTGIVKITTGAGSDTIDISAGNSTATINTGNGTNQVIVGASSNITAADSIVGGTDTDTVTVTDATINATTKTTLALGVSGFEVVKTTAASVTTIDFNALSSYDIVEVAGVLTGLAVGGGATSANTGAAGLDAVTATIENADTLILSSDIVGPAGGTTAGSGGRGGDAITLTPRLDNGSNVANLKLYGDVDLTGDIGGAAAAAGSTAGSGDSAIDAVSIEVLNIKLQGTQATTADDLAFVAGAAGATGGGSAGSAGDTVVVGSNATINVTDELVGSGTKYNNLDLGTVNGQNVTINASTFHGKLAVAVVSSGAGNVAIYGGSAADTLTGGTGADIISGGAGTDSITGGTGADVLTGGADADTFVFGTTGSVSGTSLDEITDFGKASDILSFTAVTVLAAESNGTTATSDVDTTTGGKISFAPADDTFAKMVVAILADSELDVAGSTAFFEFGSDTYVYNAGSATGGADDQIIKLTGVTGLVTITDLGTTLTIA